MSINNLSPPKQKFQLDYTENRKEDSNNEIHSPLKNIVFSETSPFKSPISSKGISKRKFHLKNNNKIQNYGRIVKSKITFEEETNSQCICASYKITRENSLYTPIIATQLFLIEKSLKEDHQYDSESIRHWICNFVNQNNTVFSGMEELGALYFFLERGGDLPNVANTSYMKLRAEEIREEIILLKENCREVFTNNDGNQTSGKAHYIERAFAHMILTKKQVVNKGAFYSLRAYLNDPSYGICEFFKPEYRNSLLTILENLENDPKLDELLGMQFTIHKTMKPYVLLTLKRSYQKTATSVHALWAILISLFFDLRQHVTEENCYAIAPLNYTLLNHTTTLIKFMIEVIRDGKIDGINILSIDNEFHSQQQITEEVFTEKIEKYDLLNFFARINNEESLNYNYNSSTLPLNVIIKNQFPQEKLKLDFEKQFFSFQRNPLKIKNTVEI